MITPNNENANTDATTLTSWLQNNIFHPAYCLFFVPGKANSSKTAAIMPNSPLTIEPATPLKPPPSTTSGEKTVRTPKLASVPSNPNIPNINAIHGVILTMLSRALLEIGGSFKNHSSAIASHSLKLAVFLFVAMFFTSSSSTF